MPGRTAARLVAVLAGEAAENVLLGVSEPDTYGQDSCDANDLLKCLIAKAGKPIALDGFRKHARSLVAEHAFEIRAVAGALMACRELHGSTVATIMHWRPARFAKRKPSFAQRLSGVGGTLFDTRRHRE